MSDLVDSRVISPEPSHYTVPPFPSLYWPFPVDGSQSRYLYRTSDIWRFTLYWTLIFYAALHGAAAVYALAVQLFGHVGVPASASKIRKGAGKPQKGRAKRAKGAQWKVIWIIPVWFAVIGGMEAVVAGSVVGALLGAIYNAGYFQMSTWMPFVWALINSLIVILSSFAIQGGL